MNKIILLIKFETLFFLIFIIYICNKKKINCKNTFEDYFNLILCKFLNIEENNNCNKIFNNINVNDNIYEITKNIELLLNKKKPKIENIFILIGLFPFLKNNSTIMFKINDKEIYILFKCIFKNRKIRKINNISIYDYPILEENFNDLINYKWELIPNHNIQKILRFIINKYYNETCVDIFDKSLNFNLKNYINNRKKELSIKQIKQLMCKYKLFYYIIY